MIAAINGVALGGGFELALAGDMIVADPAARFGLPEPTARLAALSGGIARLIETVGEKRAVGEGASGGSVAGSAGDVCLSGSRGGTRAFAEPRPLRWVSP